MAAVTQVRILVTTESLFTLRVVGKMLVFQRYPLYPTAQHKLLCLRLRFQVGELFNLIFSCLSAKHFSPMVKNFQVANAHHMVGCDGEGGVINTGALFLRTKDYLRYTKQN